MDNPLGLSTPALDVLGQTFANEKVRSGEKTLAENWENVERDNHDPYCVMHYGVSDGKVFGHCVQENIGEYAEMCRLYREAELEQKKNHDNNPLLKAFILPRAIELELNARGFETQPVEGNYDPDLLKLMDTEFSAFKTTNYLLSAMAR